MKRLILLCMVLVIVCGVFSCASKNAENTDIPPGFTSIFDGKTLNGWRKLTEYSGEDGKWEIIDGTIAGDQYPEGKGGLLVHEKKYSDYEVIA